jgi:hypothetical protein
MALVAADRVLAAADEWRARRDLRRIVEARECSPRPATAPDGVALVPWVETQLVRDGLLLPDGLPSGWLGASVEAYGVPTGPTSTVSFALRWHGARPAVLWEQGGQSVELTAPVVAPGWSTGEVAGEALWPIPPGAEVAADDPPAVT